MFYSEILSLLHTSCIYFKCYNIAKKIPGRGRTTEKISKKNNKKIPKNSTT